MIEFFFQATVSIVLLAVMIRVVKFLFAKGEKGD